MGMNRKKQTMNEDDRKRYTRKYIHDLNMKTLPFYFHHFNFFPQNVLSLNFSLVKESKKEVGKPKMKKKRKKPTTFSSFSTFPLSLRIFSNLPNYFIPGNA